MVFPLLTPRWPWIGLTCPCTSTLQSFWNYLDRTNIFVSSKTNCPDVVLWPCHGSRALCPFFVAMLLVTEVVQWNPTNFLAGYLPQKPARAESPTSCKVVGNGLHSQRPGASHRADPKAGFFLIDSISQQSSAGSSHICLLTAGHGLPWTHTGMRKEN